MLQPLSSVSQASFAEVHFSQERSQRGGDKTADEQNDENIQIGQHCGLSLDLAKDCGGGAFAGFDRVSPMRNKSLCDSVQLLLELKRSLSQVRDEAILMQLAAADQQCGSDGDADAAAEVTH